MRLAGGLTLHASGVDLEVRDAADATLAVLTFAIPGEPIPGWTPDTEELRLTDAGGVRCRLRLLPADEVVTVQVSVDNTGADAVELPYLGVGVAPGPGWAAWTWACDLDGFVVIASTAGADGALGIRLRQGFLRLAGAERCYAGPDADGRGAFFLSPPSAGLGGYRRHDVTLEIRALPSLDAARTLLPGWVPDVLAPAGAPVEITLPDEALVPDAAVTATLVDTEVVLTGTPGHHRVAVHGPRGVGRLTLTWTPAVADVLPAVVAGVVRRRPSRASDAAGFCVAEACVRGLAPDLPKALDWLDGVDWLDRGTLLGDATAGVLAGLLDERTQLDATWRLLGRRSVTPGYGLVVMRVWLAGLAATGEPSLEAGALLARTTEDPHSALELALLSKRSAEVLSRPLRGLVNLLGGGLPGRPVGLAAQRAAIAASLLRLCPESWPDAVPAFEASDKTRGLLLADYASVLDAEPNSTADLDGLAWLLLGELGI